MATTVTLTMNEVPFQLIHGLTVTKDGVSFTFSEPTLSTSYNSGGPGTITFVQDPSITGQPPRPFQVSFSVPVDFIQFGVALLIGPPAPPVSVTLSNGSVLLVNLTPLVTFPEGQFTYSGVPVTGFTLTPAPNALAWAFDNLTVNTVTATVPEPASVSLLVFGLIAGTLFARRVSDR
jgi:hypothetical protein